MSKRRELGIDELASRIDALAGVASMRRAAAASGVEAYVVGGAVRDALLGLERADLDVVTVGPAAPLLAELDAPARVFERFGTATVSMPEGEIDIARARTEAYPRPGALPEVRPASSIEDDLGRRDFTVNAIAVSLADPGAPVDPHGGLGDLAAGRLRLLHARSIADDPTRALRAARYAARLDLRLEPASAAQIRAAELASVSAERVDAELVRLAAEPSARRGFELLADWGLLELPDGAGPLIESVGRLGRSEGWRELGDGGAAILAAARGRLGAARELAALEEPPPSAAVAAARGRSPSELLLARALGARWLDAYVRRLRHVRLEISGHDLLEAGIAQGPELGRALAAAHDAKLDGRARGRAAELEVALAAARRESQDETHPRAGGGDAMA